MSRSRLMPGKTMTADFMGGYPADLDAVVLDHGVCEQLLRRVPEPGLGTGAVAVGDLDVEHLALAHAGDAGDAERFERALDRLALRIENAGLECDCDAGLHRAPR